MLGDGTCDHVTETHFIDAESGGWSMSDAELLRQRSKALPLGLGLDAPVCRSPIFTAGLVALLSLPELRGQRPQATALSPPSHICASTLSVTSVHEVF